MLNWACACAALNVCRQEWRAWRCGGLVVKVLGMAFIAIGQTNGIGVITLREGVRGRVGLGLGEGQG
jgi:hypothetical protein